jgi:peptide/nickel transport system permease protein
MRRFGTITLAAAVLLALAAPLLSPHPPDEPHPAFLNAPPTRPRLRDASGGWRRPFIYRWRLVNRLEQRYELDRSMPIDLVAFHGGRLLRSADDAAAPLMLLGSDSYGRDVLSRLLHGARTSLGLAVLAALGATLVGAALGGLAGYAGGAVDEALMRTTDMIIVLPAMYIALALRSVLPLVLPASTVFIVLAALFALLGAPFIARGVRAIVRAERAREYADAARALGASPARVLLRHLLPAARGFVAVEVTMLVPAFIVAEATLSFVGLGFPGDVASWGTMLQDATAAHVFTDFPWLLSPAAAMFAVVLGINLALERGAPDGRPPDLPRGVESFR